MSEADQSNLALALATLTEQVGNAIDTLNRVEERQRSGLVTIAELVIHKEAARDQLKELQIGVEKAKKDCDGLGGRMSALDNKVSAFMNRLAGGLIVLSVAVTLFGGSVSVYGMRALDQIKENEFKNRQQDDKIMEMKERLSSGVR